MGKGNRVMQEELNADIAGQKLSLKSQSLNTVITILTFVIVAVIAVSGYSLFVTHASDTKEASKELSLALKEITQAAREQNCLISLPQDRRQANAELCKRISR